MAQAKRRHERLIDESHETSLAVPIGGGNPAHQLQQLLQSRFATPDTAAGLLAQLPPAQKFAAEVEQGIALVSRLAGPTLLAAAVAGCLYPFLA
jgi:hypothetical protein